MTLSFRQAFRTSPELETGQDRRQLALRALGQSNVFVFGKLAESIKPQARELLFYLADNGRADRDKLVEVFWKAYPPGRQAANLHMTIYNLRQALGRDSILLDGTAYSLQFRGQVRFDVRAFESASSAVEKLLAGDPRRYFALTEAVRLYSGPFLPEISSDWAEERRRLLERRYIDLVSDLADEALVRNDPALSLIRMREALLVDPLSDNLNMKYLRLLSIDNRRSEIVAHYQRYVEQLSTELGLDPPSEMRELYSRVLE
jgi:two-component SAPR family response regulator